MTMKPWWNIELGPGWEKRLDAKVEEFLAEQMSPLVRACRDGLKFLDSLPEDYLTAENAAAYRAILNQALGET